MKPSWNLNKIFSFKFNFAKRCVRYVHINTVQCIIWWRLTKRWGRLWHYVLYSFEWHGKCRKYHKLTPISHTLFMIDLRNNPKMSQNITRLINNTMQMATTPYKREDVVQIYMKMSYSKKLKAKCEKRIHIEHVRIFPSHMISLMYLNMNINVKLYIVIAMF